MGQAQGQQGKQIWAISATLGSAATSTKCGAQKACAMTTTVITTITTTTTTKGTTECRRARPFGQTDASSSSQVFGRSSNRTGSNASSMLGGVSSSGQANSVESIWGPGSF